MKISTKGRDALRVMVDIAENGKDGSVSISEISNRQEISNKYLEQIISKLVKANFLKSSRGQTGGYKLVKKPSEYRVGDILRVSEGNLSPLKCLHDYKCLRQEKCLTFDFWEGLDKVINNYADSVTLEDLLKK